MTWLSALVDHAGPLACLMISFAQIVPGMLAIWAQRRRAAEAACREADRPVLVSVRAASIQGKNGFWVVRSRDLVVNVPQVGVYELVVDGTDDLRIEINGVKWPSKAGT